MQVSPLPPTIRERPCDGNWHTSEAQTFRFPGSNPGMATTYYYEVRMPYADPAKQSAHQLARINRRRKEWFLKNGPCVKCGSWNDLELDHKDRKQKLTHRIWTYGEEKRIAELAKCQALCRSCHKIKTSAERATPLIHGTFTGYAKKRCRCIECTKANAAHHRAWLKKNKKRAGDGNQNTSTA